MAWRLAYSLEALRNQVNMKFPRRSKASDGTIGDEAHRSRSSDHNPWIPSKDREGRDIGIVSALDLTHDPRNGFDAHKFADMLKEFRDERIKYVISNKRIWNPSISKEWRPYSGSNPHTLHVHISVHSHKDLYDDRGAWTFSDFTVKPQPQAPEVKNRPLLKRGMDGIEVDDLREAIVIAIQSEPNFGPLLEGAIMGFQRANGLSDDGKVGTYTWEKLEQKGIIDENG